MAFIDPHQTGFVGKGSDHLQLIKFWPSRTPGKGVCGGAKIFGSALLQPACNICVSSERFFHYWCISCVCLYLYTILLKQNHMILLTSDWYRIDVMPHFKLLFIVFGSQGVQLGNR